MKNRGGGGALGPEQFAAINAWQGAGGVVDAAQAGSDPLIALLLEDFAGSAVRKNWDGITDLWQLASGPQVQTGGFHAASNTFRSTLVTQDPDNISAWIYIHFQPRGDPGGFPYPEGYMQHYVKGGTWSALMTRLRFKVTCNENITRNPDGRDNLQIGTYVKNHADVDLNTQGQHYYHLLGLNYFANEPLWLYLPPQPQHLVSAPGDRNAPYDPEFPASSHYWDGLTNWYYDGFCSEGTTFIWDDFTFEQVDSATEPIAMVQGSTDPAPLSMQLAASIGVTYNPGAGKFEVTWAGPKNLSSSYRVAYKTSSMKAAGGWDSGTWDGTTLTSNLGTYTGRLWQSPALPRQVMFFGIKPTTNNPSAFFTEVMYRG
jgi:hypothetical protein